MSLRFVALVAAATALTLSAQAEERQTSPTEPPPAAKETAPVATAPAPPTMQELLNEGYEVKTMSVVPQEIVVRAGATTSVDAAMIILQKGSIIATCYTVFSSLTDGSLVTLPCNVSK